MRQAVLRARTWISSATMLTASSSGVSAPMSRPIGECTRARSSSPNPASSERLDDARPLAPARHEADVAGRGAHRLQEDVDVVRVAASDNDNVCGRRPQALERAIEGSEDDRGAGETARVGELVAVVEDGDGEAGRARRGRDRAGQRGRRRR